jgi:hypothetical protein
MAAVASRRTSPNSAPKAVVAASAPRWAPVALALGLLVVTLYAVFAHGANAIPAEPRVQVGLEGLGAVMAAVCLWTGTVRLAAPRAAWAGIALLGAFAVWSGISVLWSITPDLTWIEFNRVVSYGLVVLISLAISSSLPNPIRFIVPALLGLIVIVSLYGLGQKLLPGLHVAGLLDLNQTGRVARLQEPLGYWNALALLLAMGVPLAWAVAAQRGGHRSLRLGAIVSLELILVAGGFTTSRGALLALLVAGASLLLLAHERLRLLLWLGMGALAALPPLVLGLTSHALTGDGVALGSREHAGLLLLIVVTGSAVVLTLAADRIISLEASFQLAPAARQRIVKALLAAAGLAVPAVLVGLAASSRGLPGTVSHAWSSFTEAQGISVSNPDRLLSIDSANRWVWWKEALGAFWDRPLGGWGAGSFPAVHLLYRHDFLPVTHAHSAPLEWLAETGLVGLLLAAGAWWGLLRSGIAAVRAARSDTTRALLTAAAFASVLAYVVHAFYDWDWDMPGLTFPALILAGTLAGATHSRVTSPSKTGPQSPFDAGPAARLLALFGAGLAACTLVLSSALPSLSAGRASAALLAASVGDLRQAHSDAALAAALDPLSDSGPVAEATIALNRGDKPLTRAYLLEAINREPTDVGAWEQLSLVDLDLGRLQQDLVVAQRVLELDPLSATARGVALGAAAQAELREAPPQASATATTTPDHGRIAPVSSSSASASPSTSSASPSIASSGSP